MALSMMSESALISRLAAIVVVVCCCSLQLVFGRVKEQAEIISLVRAGSWQYEVVKGRHDQAIATSVLRNDVNETGYV